MGFGVKIIIVYIGKVLDDEKSVYYDKMLCVCNEIGDLVFRFGGFFVIEMGFEKVIVLKWFLEIVNLKGLVVNFDLVNIISDVNENLGEGLLLLKDYIV